MASWLSKLRAFFTGPPPAAKPKPLATLPRAFRVKSVDGNWIGGAMVSLGGINVASKTTEPNGHVEFQLPVAPLGQKYSVFVTAPGHQRVEQHQAYTVDGKIHQDPATVIEMLPIVVVPPKPVIVLPSISVVGKEFRSHGRSWVPRLVGQMTLLAESEARVNQVLDQAVEEGFNGIDCFGGFISWKTPKPQEAANAREFAQYVVLPACEKRGLAFKVRMLTDSAAGTYDIEAHVRDWFALLAGRRYALATIANEPYHGSHSSIVHDYDTLRAWGRKYASGTVWSVGAAEVDEPALIDTSPNADKDGPKRYPTHGGSFNEIHPGRGREFWDDIRHRREGEDITALYDRPTLSAESLVAAEAPGPRGRESDPVAFAALGVLDAACHGSGGVFFSEQGLRAEVLTGKTLACARAYVKGSKLVSDAFPDGGLRYVNTGYVDQGAFARAASGVNRLYHFVAANGNGIAIAIGATPAFTVDWIDGLVRTVGIDLPKQDDDTRLIVWTVKR